MTGSAVVLRTDGYLVTALAMASGADAIAVVLPDGRHLAATVVGNDVDHGLALLHVRAWHLQLPRVAGSAQLHQGDPAVAVGVAAHGESAIVTTGVVRGVGLRVVTKSRGGPQGGPRRARGARSGLSRRGRRRGPVRRRRRVCRALHAGRRAPQRWPISVSAVTSSSTVW